MAAAARGGAAVVERAARGAPSWLGLAVMVLAGDSSVRGGGGGGSKQWIRCLDGRIRPSRGWIWRFCGGSGVQLQSSAGTGVVLGRQLARLRQCRLVVRPGGARRRGDVGRQRWLCGVGVEVGWTAAALLVSLLSRYGGEADVGRAGHTRLFAVRRQQRRLRVMAEWAAWGWRRWLEVFARRG